MADRRTIAAAGMLTCAPLALFLWATLRCAEYCSPTFDEPAHLVAGYSYWTTRDFRLDQDVPPLSKLLAALPVLALDRSPFAPDPELWKWGDQFGLGTQFLFQNPDRADYRLRLARLPSVGAGLLLALLCGWWARRLWGNAAGWTALALAACDPNLIAHSATVNSDVLAALFWSLSLYCLWEYSRAPAWTLLIAGGVVTGLALVTKFTCLLLLPVIFAAALASLASGKSLLPGRRGQSGSRSIAGESAALCLHVVAAAAVFPPVHLFRGWTGFATWLEGLRVVREHLAVGHPSFLLGEYSLTGWWLFYVIVFLVKTPLGTLMLLGASLALWNGGTRFDSPAVWTVLLPALTFFAAASASTVDIGARHILPVYALCWVLASRAATLWPAGPWLSIVAVGCTALSSLGMTPYQLAYFNELSGGPELGHQLLLDSNLDWGQDLKGLRDYLHRANLDRIYLSYFGSVPPGRYGIRYRALPGNPTWNDKDPNEDPADPFPAGASRHVIAISASNLQGLWPPRMRLDYGWLLGRKPLARIGFGIWVWEITGDAQAHLKLAETFLRWNKPRLAARELKLAVALSPDLTDARKLLDYLTRSGAGVRSRESGGATGPPKGRVDPR